MKEEKETRKERKREKNAGRKEIRKERKNNQKRKNIFNHFIGQHHIINEYSMQIIRANIHDNRFLTCTRSKKEVIPATQ